MLSVFNTDMSLLTATTLREEKTAEESPAEEKTAEIITAIWQKKTIICSAVF